MGSVLRVVGYVVCAWLGVNVVFTVAWCVVMRRRN